MNANDQVRRSARRATDAVRAVVATTMLVLVSVIATSGTVDLASWQRFVAELPTWCARGCAAVVILALAIALAVSLASLTRLRSDPAFTRDVVAVLAMTFAAAFLVSLLVVDGGVAAGSLVPSRSWVLAFPDVIVAVIAALIVVASAHVARPNRRLLWWMLAAASVCALLTDPLALLPVVGGLALGLAVGSGWLTVVGSPAGIPDAAALAASLARQGLDVGELVLQPSQTWGGAVLFATHPAEGRGTPLRVKVYGRDAVAADFWVRIVRRIAYLDAQRTWTGKGIDSVEHEAAVTALADQFGVPVTRVVCVSDWTTSDPFIAVQWPGLGIDELSDAALSDSLLESAWSGVVALHCAGIVHGGLEAATLRLDGAVVRIGDLDRGRFSCDKGLRDRDLADLLVVIGALCGAERAVASAVKALGIETVNDLVSYLEPAAIRSAPALRRDGLKRLLAALRDAITDRTGMTPPPPAELKRVTARRLVALALVIFALIAIVSALSGIDFAAVAAELADATWLLIVLALLVGQLILLPEALATMSLVPERLPLGPLIALQSAMRFLGLAVPGPAARVAANVAFLRKQGIVVARSLTLGVLDAAAGLLVELMILLGAVLVGDLSLALFGIDPPELDWGLITVVLVVAALVVFLVVRFIKPLKVRVLNAWRSVQGALDVLRDSPTRALALFSTNLAARLVSACTLWLVLASLGVQLNFVAVLVVIAASNLLSGLIPVPGNVGVAEAALTAFLVAAGVDKDIAFAAAVVYRIITAYLPTVWGAAAQRWLTHNDYL